MQLNFKKFGDGFPVIILHGLLGSLDNWQTIAKKLAESGNGFSVYIIDLRNHGRSPHSNEFSYELLAEDLKVFFVAQKITKAHIIGHSMGGKTAMLFALQNAENVEKLVIVDISPAAYSDKHSNVFDALLKADAVHADSRQQVETVLRSELPNDESTVQFLMKGLTRAEESYTGNFMWRFNLEALHNRYSEISKEITGNKPFTGKTLFIKGEKSNYINAGNFSFVSELFPNNELTEIKNAGHWVHAEQPVEFLKVVTEFLQD